MKTIQTKTNLLKLWTRKQKSRTILTALLFFTTVLHSTLSFHGTTGRVVSQQQQPTTTTVTMNRGGGNTVVSTTQSQSKVSSHLPSSTIKRYLQKKQKQTLPPFAATLFKSSSNSNNDAQELVVETTKTFKKAFTDLQTYMVGPKSDTLLLLLATSLITPLCKRLGTSPILGFLAAGMALGPNALGLISGIHTTTKSAG